jgi:hypothetical protein
MSDNVFAFTEPGQTYPAYVSLNLVDETSPRPFELLVRTRGEQTPQSIRLSRVDVYLLAQSIRAKLNPT